MQDRKALIVYGSETGNAQDAAEELGRICERLRFSTRVVELNAIGLAELFGCVVIFVVSTAGQGEIPGNAQTFWKRLRSTRLKPGCLGDVQFTSFGLGDSSYPKFNWAHRKLYNRFRQLGAESICERGESDEQHPEGIDGSFVPWTSQFQQALLGWSPLPEGVEPIPDDVFLPPPWEICLDNSPELEPDLLPFESNDQPTAPQTNGHTPTAPQTNGHTPVDTTLTTNPNTSLTNNASIPSHGKFTATLLNNTRLTPETHWQDVRLLTFSTPNLDYKPGDVLTIYPHNSSTAVAEFLELMNWSSIADKPIHFHPSSNSTTTPSSPPPLQSSPAQEQQQQLTLRTLLTNHLDLNAIPRRSFFTLIAHFTTDQFQRARLLEFTDPQYIDELFDYTTRPRRSVLEVLQEFHTVRIPLRYLAAVLPWIRGRQYSIASGGRLKYRDGHIHGRRDASGGGGERQGRIQLLVALVRYRTVIKKLREGLCSRYISSLQPGTELDVLLCKGGMKIDLHRPAVMVGPGTGVAPLRALVWERAMLTERAKVGDAAEAQEGQEKEGGLGEGGQQKGKGEEQRQLLFFGGRNRSQDYFFEDEWVNLRNNGVPLDVFAGFSRDQESKLYVQHLITQNSAAVYDALKPSTLKPSVTPSTLNRSTEPESNRDGNGILYICGSSGKMPLAVREAIVEVFEKEGKMGRSEAEEVVGEMEKGGRVWQETW